MTTAAISIHAARDGNAQRAKAHAAVKQVKSSISACNITTLIKRKTKFNIPIGNKGSQLACLELAKQIVSDLKPQRGCSERSEKNAVLNFLTTRQASQDTSLGEQSSGPHPVFRGS